MKISEKLKGDNPLIGVYTSYPNPGMIENIGPDWDWFWLDTQHGLIVDHRDLLAMVRACESAGVAPIVRVPTRDAYPEISRALDMGSQGVIVPQIDTAEQARKIVAAAKFPPLGDRSFGSRRLIDQYGRGYGEKANDECLLVAQIESPMGLDNLDEIASVPGIDALCLGPDDIYIRSGIGIDEPRSEKTLGEYLRRTVEACRRHGKYAMALGIGVEMFELCRSYGYDLIVAGTEAQFLIESSSRASKMARECMAKAELAKRA